MPLQSTDSLCGFCRSRRWFTEPKRLTCLRFAGGTGRLRLKSPCPEGKGCNGDPPSWQGCGGAPPGCFAHLSMQVDRQQELEGEGERLWPKKVPVYVMDIVRLSIDNGGRL